MHAPKLNAEQIDTILNKLVPLAVIPKDRESVTAILRLYAEEKSAMEFAALVEKILNLH
jgi:hypothetical protein